MVEYSRKHRSPRKSPKNHTMKKLEEGEKMILSIYEKYGLYNKCYYLGNKKNFSDKDWLFLIRDYKDNEKDQDTYYQKFFLGKSPSAGDKFVCRIYRRDLSLAYIEFTFVKKNLINIDGIYRTEGIWNSSSLKDIKKLSFGKLLMISSLYNAYKRGAKYATLTPVDDGSGKLYNFYYSIGFRCITSEGKARRTSYNDFFTGSPSEKADRNLTECYMMEADIRDVIENAKI